MRHIVFYTTIICSFFIHIISFQKTDLLEQFEGREKICQIRGIDEIYVINLDSRPEKLALCLEQLKKYDLSFLRFSAINGRYISTELELSVGNKVHSGSCFEKKIYGLNPVSRNVELISESKIGDVFFHPSMTRGAIGCYLSHLSILKHSLKKGYKRILILEDDFVFNEDPYLISSYIENLDLLFGTGWDILFLNDLSFFDEKTLCWSHPEQDIIFKKYLFKNKLDYSSCDYRRIGSSLKKGYLINGFDDNYGLFRKISGRFGTYSMVVNISGAKKILNFFNRYGMFWPYDDELSIILDLNMFNIKKNLIDVMTDVSDTIGIK